MRLSFHSQSTMETIEAPSVQNASRKEQFSLINWLSKAKFEDQLKSNIDIYPHLNSIDYDDGDEDDDKSSYVKNQSSLRRIYIGRSRQMHTSEGVQYGSDNYNADQAQINLEIIGSVVRNLITGLWELHVSHGGAHLIIQQDFLVLSIEDPNSFEWKRARKGDIPALALRGCIDRFSNEYFYIGKVPKLSEAEKIEPKYFRRFKWLQFAETVPARFGKVHVSHQCLYVGFNNIELAFSDYDILCLRPTPAPLSILSRIILRKICQDSNEKISFINTTHKKYLPDYLIQFLKYPSRLTSGKYKINKIFFFCFY